MLASPLNSGPWDACRFPILVGRQLQIGLLLRSLGIAYNEVVVSLLDG
jgi:hypothetical protein